MTRARPEIPPAVAPLPPPPHTTLPSDPAPHEAAPALCAALIDDSVRDELGPLIARRSLLAAPIGGSARLIDFALAGCEASGARSLFDGGGTAAIPITALFASSAALRERGADHVLILPAAQLAITDCRPLLELHGQRAADLTLAVSAQVEGAGPRRREVRTDGRNRVRGLGDAADTPSARFATPGLTVSTGVCVIRLDALERLGASAAAATSVEDLAAHALELGLTVQAWECPGFWRDIASLEGYWAANMELLAPVPPLTLEVAGRTADLPPATFTASSRVTQSLVAAGALIEGEVEHSVVSPGAHVEAGAVVRDSILLRGARVAAGAIVERAILDEGAEVPAAGRVGVAEVSAFAGECHGLRTTRLTFVAAAEATGEPRLLRNPLTSTRPPLQRPVTPLPPPVERTAS